MREARAKRGGEAPDLRRVIAQLPKPARMPKLPRHALQIILWENIGYLIDDERRKALFDEFGTRVGFDAAAIAKAPKAVLDDIAQRGGMNASARAGRWREIAAIVIEKAGGDLQRTLKALPVAKARSLLKTFPAIGETGADKVLLLSGIDVRPALESNGLRAMLRLGLCAEGASYAVSYKAATAALAAHGELTRQWFTTAYYALRAHGQSLCKGAAPRCMACPLDAVCAHAKLKGTY